MEKENISPPAVEQGDHLHDHPKPSELPHTETMLRDLRNDAAEQSEPHKDTPTSYTNWEKFEPSYNLHNYGGTATVEGLIGYVNEGSQIMSMFPREGTFYPNGTLVFNNGAKWELKDGLQADVKTGGRVELSYKTEFPISEDQQLTKMRIQALHDLGVEPGSLSMVRNDGGGPKLATDMEMVGFLKPGGYIEHRDYAPMNVAFMEAMQRGEAYTYTNNLGLQVTMHPREPWGAFEPGIKAAAQEVYGAQHAEGFENTQEKALSVLRVEQGSITDDWKEGKHPDGQVAHVADFVYESITDKIEEVQHMIGTNIGMLREGDVFAYRFVQNDPVSEDKKGGGYPGGVDTNYPNVALQKEDHHAMFNGINQNLYGSGRRMRFIIESTSDDAADTFREGYHGLTSVTGIIEKYNPDNVATS